MVDVRILTDTLWRIPPCGADRRGRAGGLLLGAGARRDGYAAIFMGGLLSTGLLVADHLFVLLSWRTFFVTLHDVFFEPGSWTFDWSSTPDPHLPGPLLVRCRHRAGRRRAGHQHRRDGGRVVGRRGRTLHNRSE